MARRDESGDNNDGTNGPNQSQQQHSRRRFRTPRLLPLNRPDPPSPDVTVEEGYYLFNGFMHEELERADLQPPYIPIEIPTSHTHISFATPLTEVPRARGYMSGDCSFSCDGPTTMSSNLQNSSTTVAPKTIDYRKMGQEIRQCADDFFNSTQGQKVKEKANQVDLESLDCDSFMEILSGVFHDGEFSRTTIVAVFVFCSTIVIRALQASALKISSNIIKWCFQYIKDGVCTVVQQEGGWEAVLDGMVGRLFRLGATFVIASAALAALFFIWRK